jgi:hypothetical protein
MSTLASSYAIFTEFTQAGWKRDFDTSPGGFLCVEVDGAPSLGSNPGGVLFAGCWTRPDGLSLFQRSNMDRSVTTIVIDPYGNTLHDFRRASLAEACDHIRSLNL